MRNSGYGWRRVLERRIQELGSLCLAKEAIIATPRSFWLTVKAGLFAGLQNPAAMQRAWKRSDDVVGHRVLQDEVSSKWRRYEIVDFDRVCRHAQVRHERS